MNERDSEAVAAMLRDRGYSIVGAESDADVILLNTCSVRDLAEQKALGKARLLLSARRKGKTSARVGLMGCMAQNRGESLLESLPDLDLIAGTQKFHRVPEMIGELARSLSAQGPRPHTLIDIEEEAGSQNTIRAHDPQSARVSAFVSIMQGCDMRCSFCIVPKTRGAERCRPISDIVEECEELAAAGTREVMLLGQIVTSYGRRDIPFKNGKSPFVQLLEAVQEVKGIKRIRFMSPHPRGFKQDLVEAYRDLPKLCNQAHLPAQSFSDRILKAMNRPYSADRYMEIVDALRKAAPDIYFSTDIIVGFPGETDGDFELTRSCFERIGFDMAFIFKYSPRPGSPADAVADDVPAEVKESRNQALLRILEKSSLARNESLVGSTQEILVEGAAKRGEGLFAGRTRGGRKTIFPASARHVGELVSVKIQSASVNSLMGELA